MIPVALYDACVLFPPSLRDLLVWLGITGACRARWSEAIHDEWIQAVLDHRPSVLRSSLERCRDLMNRNVAESLVTEYEGLIPSLELPDSDDRHILAAAIHCEADCIVTFNLKDFPASALHPHGIEAIHPDDFVCQLLDSSPEFVCFPDGSPSMTGFTEVQLSCAKSMVMELRELSITSRSVLMNVVQIGSLLRHYSTFR